ncbi:MAG: GNAT family N-acetyltransferase [Pseudohongiella sp.]|nr:GNAT family N-acetyltransferase [Pseudohongiella sp.]
MKDTANKTHMVSAVDDCAQAIHESWQQRAGLKNDMPVTTPDLREITYGSDDYKTTLALRHRILREPLGLNLWHENLSVEIDQRHFTLWQQTASLTASVQHNTELLACLVIVPKSPGCAKLRQMAVNDRYQRQGFGQRLIALVEAVLVNEGVELVELHARESAVGFYQASGYQRVGPAFTEVGLPHQRMTKNLKPNVGNML